MATSPKQIEALGKSLREIRADYLREEGGEPVRWYQGRAGTDLFAWLGPDNAPSRLQLTFARSVVEWDATLGLRTGRMDASFGGGPGRFDTYLIKGDDFTQREILAAARELLRASPVDRVLAAPLIEALDRVLAPSPADEASPAAPGEAPQPAAASGADETNGTGGSGSSGPGSGELH